MDVAVRFNHVTKGFNDGNDYHKVLDDISFSLEQGKTVALTGPSGSGKSTLLNLIAGFEFADKGDILLADGSCRYWQDSQWSEFRRQHLGVIFQQFNLLTPLNVRENIAFPLSLLGQDWSDWGDHLMDVLGLTSFAKRSVEQLSGGQQQRVAIARALVHKPKLLLADEPTGNLDQHAGMQVMNLLCQLASEAGSTVLMVTHSQDCAAFMDCQWQLHQGRLVEYSSSSITVLSEPIVTSGQTEKC